MLPRRRSQVISTRMFTKDVNKPVLPLVDGAGKISDLLSKLAQGSTCQQLKMAWRMIMLHMMDTKLICGGLIHRQGII